MSDPGTGIAQSAESPKGPRPQLGRPELAIVLGVFLVLAVLLTTFKVLRIDLFRGDSAQQFQVTENIATHGVGVSNVSATVIDFAFASGLPTVPAAEYAKNPLPATEESASNLLEFHSYYILYPIAVFAKIFPAPVVLLTLDVCSFVGLLLLAYFTLRRRNVSVAAAVLFCILVVSHPSWSSGLIWGQFYPDRLYLFLGFLFMLLVSRADTKRPALLLSGILCAAIDERAALMTGVFLLTYTLLFWKTERDRYFKLGICAALLCYGEFIVKFVIANPYYSSFLPTNLSQVIGELQQPAFVHGIGIFMLVNAPLLALALFRWRWAVIAFVMMLPNIFGNIGGAEKTGWSTHYHASYFPALVLAALFGFVALYQWCAATRRLPAAYGIAAALIVLLSMTNQYSASDPILGLSNLSNQFLVVFPQQAAAWISPAGFRLHAVGNAIRKAVPEGSTVSSVESGMALLYHRRNIQFFPLDIDRANYAVMDIAAPVDGKPTLGGAVSYLGQQEADAIDVVLRARMMRDGYDFNKAILFPDLGIGIVHRGKRPPAGSEKASSKEEVSAVAEVAPKAPPATPSFPRPSADAAIVQHNATVAAQGIANPTDLTGTLIKRPSVGNIILAFGSTGFGCKVAQGWTMIGTDPNTASAVAYRIVRKGDTTSYVPFTTPTTNGYTLELIEIKGGPDILGSSEAGGGYGLTTSVSNRLSLDIPQVGGILFQLYSGMEGASTKGSVKYGSTVPEGQKQILVDRVPRSGNALELIIEATVTDPRKAPQPFMTDQTITFADNKAPGNINAGWLVWVGGVRR